MKSITNPELPVWQSGAIWTQLWLDWRVPFHTKLRLEKNKSVMAIIKTITTGSAGFGKTQSSGKQRTKDGWRSYKCKHASQLSWRVQILVNSLAPQKFRRVVVAMAAPTEPTQDKSWEHNQPATTCNRVYEPERQSGKIKN